MRVTHKMIVFKPYLQIFSLILSMHFIDRTWAAPNEGAEGYLNAVKGVKNLTPKEQEALKIKYFVTPAYKKANEQAEKIRKNNEETRALAREAQREEDAYHKKLKELAKPRADSADGSAKSSSAKSSTTQSNATQSAPTQKSESPFTGGYVRSKNAGSSSSGSGSGAATRVDSTGMPDELVFENDDEDTKPRKKPTPRKR